MALSEALKARIRHFLGNPGLNASATVSLGVPLRTDMLFIVEANFDEILESHEPTIRHIVQELECIEGQISEARTQLTVARVGTTVFREGGIDQLWREMLRWTARLADAMGSPTNPYSDLLNQTGYHSTGVIEPC